MTIPVWFQDWYNNGSGGIAAAAQTYIDRVEADGGAVESIGCVPSAVWNWVAPSFIGLLDLFPNAAAAYSLRKLRTAYNGSAIRVRKEVSAVSSETDIGFLVDGSLDTVSLLAFASDADSGDVFVVTWYDQSLSNDATQGTASAQPKIVSSGAVITEGTSAKPAIEFEHSGTRTPLNFTSPLIIGTSDFMIPVVAKNKTSDTNNYIDSGTNGLDLLYISNKPTIAESGVGQILQQASTVNNTDIYLINFLRHSGNMYSYLNGGSEVSTSDSTNLSQQMGFIGDDEVVVQEVIFYFSNQSSNRTGIETNINTFYSIYP
jgi:hypothetical protein